MKKVKSYLIPFIAAACATATTQAEVISVFSNSGDESAFDGRTTPQVEPVPDPLAESGWGVVSGSSLDGDALQIWNTGTGRGIVEYSAPEPITSGMEINLDGLIESDSSGQYLFRVGAAGGNLASLGDSAVEIRFNSGGNVRVRVDGTQTFDDVSVGLDTRFSLSLLVNTAEAGGSSLDYDKYGITGSLDPQQFSVFVNESIVGTYQFQNPSTNIGGFLLATGTGANQAVPTMQVDNISIRTGEDLIPGDPGSSGMYAGYPVLEGGFVDTGAWLGFLYVGDSPWVWSYTLNNWLFMEEPEADSPGAWVFVL